MTSFPHLATRLFNTPLALHPDNAEIVMAALADRLGIAHLFRAEQLRDAAPAPGRHGMLYGDDARDWDRPYDLVQGVRDPDLRYAGAEIKLDGRLFRKRCSEALLPLSG